MRFFAAALVALAAFGTVGAAQTPENAVAFAQIVVLSPTNFATSANLDFGTVYNTSGVVTCAACIPARFDGLGSAGRTVDISFSVPSVLTRVNNTATIPISWGTQSGRFLSD